MNITRRKVLRPFRLPYFARIMIDMGNELVELVRFKRHIDPHNWRVWTEGREDRCFVEEPLADRQTITARPGCKMWHRSKRPLAFGGSRAREWA